VIKNPFLLICFLLLIEFAILYISNQARFKKYFQFLPSIFWIYFLPMLASTFGMIDAKSPIYQKITTHLLPASLVLLLLSVDIKSIFKLGKEAIFMFFIGSAGIVLGTPLVFFLFKNWIGNDFWAGFGAISASWTGGSANMIAVKEALGVKDAVFLPMVIVDTIVPYVWMGILVAIVGLQPLFDRFNKSNRKVLDEINRRVAKVTAAGKTQWRVSTTVFIFALAILGSFFSQFLAGFLPVVKDIISAYAWTVIIVSFLGISLSFSPIRKLEAFGASRVGYFLLYFVLTSIGAKASLNNIGSAFILISAGFLLVLIHAIFLFIAARIIKAPMFLVAVASQANIGGVASAPIVAEIYQPGLASVGLLLAILGNIVGTYLGILTGGLCRWVGGM